MKLVWMLAQISTPNQMRMMPSLSAAGASSGMMMKAISKKSRKNAITKMNRLTNTRKPTCPPGSEVSMPSIHTLPPTPWSGPISTEIHPSDDGEDRQQNCARPRHEREKARHGNSTLNTDGVDHQVWGIADIGHRTHAACPKGDRGKGACERPHQRVGIAAREFEEHEIGRGVVEKARQQPTEPEIGEVV